MRILITGLLTVVGLVLGAATPASAADEMGLSHDGITFTPTLGGTVFDDGIAWVPGDTRTEVFYVRNQGNALARLTIDVLGARVTDLLDSGDLSITASAEGRSRTVVDADEHRLLTIEDIEDEQIVPVTVTVSFDESSTNETQLLASDVSFRVNLRQTGAVLDDSAGADPGDPGVQPDSGLLPDTGAPAMGWAALAAALIGAGSALIARRRTHTEGASHG
ncbi:LPXTG cell wall anchor domain-containing protein [Aeromicrobium stalagmiti]|uniref:LPXTG cell wall anchor domain-containing protein n=1 Tax=Aeromicrobium stalagmiti TaxID=2738988 RepID=UPI001568B669|nr:LPXTG cell wall anchor domain-containing protein [Aeromicrobium stalagmiti]NRQ50541.1 LPXTG cell wall anchor domain-containing protein [Aeromicrobium stalagmiti]